MTVGRYRYKYPRLLSFCSDFLLVDFGWERFPCYRVTYLAVECRRGRELTTTTNPAIYCIAKIGR